MLWEEIYVRHIKELSMTIRKYPDGVIYEFDSLDELRQFDYFLLEHLTQRFLITCLSSSLPEEKDITVSIL